MPAPVDPFLEGIVSSVYLDAASRLAFAGQFAKDLTAALQREGYAIVRADGDGAG
jgi:hypothetical protein